MKKSIMLIIWFVVLTSVSHAINVDFQVHPIKPKIYDNEDLILEANITNYDIAWGTGKVRIIIQVENRTDVIQVNNVAPDESVVKMINLGTFNAGVYGMSALLEYNFLGINNTVSSPSQNIWIHPSTPIKMRTYSTIDIQSIRITPEDIKVNDTVTISFDVNSTTYNGYIFFTLLNLKNNTFSLEKGLTTINVTYLIEDYGKYKFEAYTYADEMGYYVLKDFKSMTFVVSKPFEKIEVEKPQEKKKGGLVSKVINTVSNTISKVVSTVSDILPIPLEKKREYCGDEKCINEDCESCPKDCKCGSNEMCKPKDNNANSEGCILIPTTTSLHTTSTYTVTTTLRKEYCGDGECKLDENCETCTADCKCSENYKCEPSSSQQDNKGCILIKKKELPQEGVTKDRVKNVIERISGIKELSDDSIILLRVIPETDSSYEAYEFTITQSSDKITVYQGGSPNFDIKIRMPLTKFKDLENSNNVCAKLKEMYKSGEVMMEPSSIEDLIDVACAKGYTSIAECFGIGGVEKCCWLGVGGCKLLCKSMGLC